MPHHPHDVYGAMVLAYNTGRYETALFAAGLLRRWLETSPDARFFGRKRAANLVTIERAARERLETQTPSKGL